MVAPPVALYVHLSALRTQSTHGRRVTRVTTWPRSTRLVGRNGKGSAVEAAGWGGKRSQGYLEGTSPSMTVVVVAASVIRRPDKKTCKPLCEGGQSMRSLCSNACSSSSSVHNPLLVCMLPSPCSLPFAPSLAPSRSQTELPLFVIKARSLCLLDASSSEQRARRGGTLGHVMLSVTPTEQTAAAVRTANRPTGDVSFPMTLVSKAASSPRVAQEPNLELNPPNPYATSTIRLR